MRNFNFHNDPGHGWLAVKIDLLDRLGLIDRISGFSYIKGKTAYLEEDCDVALFASEFRAKIGEFYTTSMYYEKSPVRSYPRYNPETARRVLEKNKRSSF